MIASLYHLPQSYARTRTRELLERFDLEEAANRTVKTYSGGMRRRLDLAGSLVAEPPILFFDEPTTGLDPRGRLDMWQLISDLVAEGTTLLLTTQYLEEADRLADEIAVMDHGKVIAKGRQMSSRRALAESGWSSPWPALTSSRRRRRSSAGSPAIRSSTSRSDR